MRSALFLIFVFIPAMVFCQQFIEQTSISLSGVVFGSVKWGDYDNDGDLDILLTGNGGVDSTVSKIYRNNGDNTFSEMASISLTYINSSSVTWGDYNNDGYLDILLCGWNGTQRITKLYRNNGNNTFTEQSSISLIGVDNCSAAWGDYDNDGDPDILLTGDVNENERTSKIYMNNGNNSFIEQTSISLIGVSKGSAVWGDYDNDGDLDILLTGLAGDSGVSRYIEMMEIIHL